MPKFQFGKYAGQDYTEVPQGYLEYLVATSETQIMYCKAEIERRKIKVEDSYMTKIVETGYQIQEAQAVSSGIDKARLRAAFDALKKAILDAAQPKPAGA